jgi:hypothetical protein
MCEIYTCDFNDIKKNSNFLFELMLKTKKLFDNKGKKYIFFMFNNYF